MTLNLADFAIGEAMFLEDVLQIHEVAGERTAGNAPGQFSRKNPSLFDG